MRRRPLIYVFSSVSERGTADDLTGDRGNTESDRACRTYRTAKRQGAAFPSRELKDMAMTGPGSQQNTTTPGSPLVVGNAHTNGDKEPLFLGVCFTHSAPNCSTTWVACFVWRLRRLKNPWDWEPQARKFSGKG